MLLMNGKKVNHLVIAGETFDKSYTAGVKAKVIGPNASIGTIRKDGTIVSGVPGGGEWYKPTGTIVTVIGMYKNAAAILADDSATISSGNWISLNDIKFID